MNRNIAIIKTNQNSTNFTVPLLMKRKLDKHPHMVGCVIYVKLWILILKTIHVYYYTIVVFATVSSAGL